jgi:hypothetical protein
MKMAIEVRKQWSGTTFSKRPPWTASDIYSVVATGSDTLTADGATSATGIPILNDPYPGRGFMLCDGVEVAQVLGPNAYLVRATYSISTRGTHFPQYVSLLAQPPRVQWSPATSQEAVDRDVHGNPLVVSSRDPIQNANRTFAFKTLRVWRYELAYNLSNAEAFENTVNNATVNVAGAAIPAGCLKCDVILPMDEYDVNSQILRIGYTFSIRLSGDSASYGIKPFQWRFLDSGRRGWKHETIGGETKNVVGELVGNLGQATTEVRLNGKGRPIDYQHLDSSTPPVTIPGWSVEGSDPVEIGTPSGATLETITDEDGKTIAVFLRYDKHRETNFATLGIF